VKRVLVVIPAFNEQETIQTAIKDIKCLASNNKTFDIEALVVSDGSTDLTKEKAKEANLLVVSLPVNLGIGGAVQAGYKYANDNGYDIVVQYDGDGQHSVDDILILINTLIQEEVNIVIGSRFIEKTNYKPSLARKIGMLFSEKLLYLGTGKIVKDTTSGFRAIDKKAIELFCKDYPEMFAGVIPLVIAFRSGLSYKEIRSNFEYRAVGKSSINLYKSIFYPIKISLAIFSVLLRIKKV
jgi:glycosyltransferase involved in cell wall biosynthesis